MADVIRIALLGSTGSIGRQTLDVVRGLEGRVRVVALASGSDASGLESQMREFRPAVAWCEREGTAFREIAEAAGAALAPMDEMASRDDVDVVVVATGGRAGLWPTIAALRAGKAVALANKEVLVMAGAYITALARSTGAELRPIDSEHSAIWQCLWGETPDAVSRLILTASGGAFRDRPLHELQRVTAAEALRHPTWRMGRKVTIDSATLMNKGFETIEARWLFDVPLERVEVVQHLESVVHSLVEFRDGSVKAQLGVPDMRLPIQCAITYPERPPVAPAPRLNLTSFGALHFGEVDTARFPCLRIAMDAGREGGTAPAVMAAADEVAVDVFLAGRCGFLDIPRVVERALNRHSVVREPSLETILEADDWARRWAAAELAAAPAR